MLYETFFIKKSKRIFIRLFFMLLLSSPMALSAQQASLNQSDIAYRTILQQSEKQLLWFASDQLTSSGLSLESLFVDLGWLYPSKDNKRSRAEQQQHDLALTTELLRLIQQNSSLANSGAENVLINAINKGETEQLLFSLIPKYQQVAQLRKAIAYYRLLSAYPWPTLDVNFQPKLGQSHYKIKAIRDILTRLGDLPQKMQTEYRRDIFDSVVINALEKFQLRHGLSVDGKLGANTYAALGISPEQRIKQLQVNLWRWFSLPTQPDKYLLVNIPSYQLSVMEYGQQVLKMKVIVGDRVNQTPQMITKINQITLNPTWTPTFNIIKNELIPEYQKNHLSLKRKKFQLVKGSRQDPQYREIDKVNMDLPKLLQSYRLVQAPGVNNALGNYRFNIPNNQFIYLHDTPVKSLFNRDFRALSHGCVRLQDAGLLAKYLLSFESDKSEQKMQAALSAGNTKYLSLNNTLPVYIAYHTAWFNQQGVLHFSADIYALDSNQSILSAI
ncbi:MAG: murein L,D-transpeptidase YcbB/YkuD [Psychromonas sp.]|jgi:murein L,D-transpeptidase YcbB/YkuD|uniref:L,D-transpeptidase family protein n=1 Tax=Psychromonas sp. TaxID=1884585 RepID=UPI0039E31FF5